MRLRHILSTILILLAWMFIPITTLAQCLFGADTCLQGFVWREASTTDHVCVTGAARTQAAADNSQVDARRVPGSDGCQSGFVWREAFPGDHVCVTAMTRAQTAVDNKRADARRDLSCTACRNGREVIIPSADVTEPAVVVEFHFANGGLVRASRDSPLDTVKVPVSGSPVRIIARAIDEQGVKDVQLWIGTQKCSFGGGSASCSGPGLLGKPTVSNTDAGGPGQHGCAERLVGHNVEVKRTPTRTVSHEVSSRAVNFQGREVSLPLIRLEPR